MSPRLPDTLRQFVAERAGFCCEYCRVLEEYFFLPFQIDHIASLKHGGGSERNNLAYACPHCNQFKGTDLTPFLESYQDFVVLFNPRRHVWNEHFDAENGLILAGSRIGEATIKTLRLNDPERLIHRQILMEDGLWPFF